VTSRLLTVQDPDLRELRDTREWLDMLTQIRGGMSRETKVNLRAEAKARGRRRAAAAGD
jgi:hypothetical protein